MIQDKLPDDYDPPETHREECPYCDDWGNECWTCDEYGYIIVGGVIYAVCTSNFKKGKGEIK